jgi:hypothetical protein
MKNIFLPRKAQQKSFNIVFAYGLFVKVLSVLNDLKDGASEIRDNVFPKRFWT